MAAPGYPDYRPENLLAYHARPLDGIWATAPYLHNGSVQNLYELLLPVAQRQTSFQVGSRWFEPEKVGFMSKGKFFTSTLDTTKVGNANTGHEYGTALTTKERWQLIEYLKTL